MKKFFYLALCAATMSFAACNNQPAEEPADTTPVAEEQCCGNCPMHAVEEAIANNDAEAAATAWAGIEAKFAELQETGDVARAHKLACKVETLIAEQGETLKGLGIDATAMQTVIETVKALPLPEGAEECCGEHHHEGGCCGHEGEHNCEHHCQH